MNYPRCIFLKTLYYRLCHATRWHNEKNSLHRIPQKYSIHADYALKRCSISVHESREDYTIAEKHRIGLLYLAIAEKAANILERIETLDPIGSKIQMGSHLNNIDELLECDWQFIYELLRIGEFKPLPYIHYYLKRAGWLQAVPVSFAVLYALLKSPKSESNEAQSFYQFFDSMLTVAATNDPTDISDPVFRGIRLGRPTEITQAWFPIHFRYMCAVELLKRNHYSVPLWESLGYLKIVADAYKNNQQISFPVLKPHTTIENTWCCKIDPSFITIYYKELFAYEKTVLINEDLLAMLIALLAHVPDDAFINKVLPDMTALIALQRQDTIHRFSESLWPLLQKISLRHHISDLWKVIIAANLIRQQNPVSDILLYYAVLAHDYDNALYIAEKRTSTDERQDFSLYETIYHSCRNLGWVTVIEALVTAGVKEIIVLSICSEPLESIENIRNIISALSLSTNLHGEYILLYITTHLVKQGKEDLALLFAREILSFFQNNSISFDIARICNDSVPRLPLCINPIVSCYLLDCGVSAENSEHVLAFLQYTAQENPDYYDMFFPLLITSRQWNSYKDLVYFAHLFTLAVHYKHDAQTTLLRSRFLALSKDIFSAMPDNDLLSLARLMHDLKETTIVANMLSVLPENTISYLHGWLIDNPSYLSQSSYEYMCNDFFLSLTTTRWSFYYIFSDYIDTFRRLLEVKGWGYITEFINRNELLFYPDAYDFYYKHRQSVEIVTILCSLNFFDDTVALMLRTIVPVHIRRVYEVWEKTKTSLIEAFAADNMPRVHRLFRTLNNPVKKNTIIKGCCDYFNDAHDYTSLLYCVRHTRSGLSEKDIITYAENASDTHNTEYALAMSEFIKDDTERIDLQQKLLPCYEATHPDNIETLITEKRYLDALAYAKQYERKDIFMAMLKNGHADYVYDHLSQHEKDRALFSEIIRHFVNDNNFEDAQRFLSLFVECKFVQSTYNPDSDEEKADLELLMAIRQNNKSAVSSIIQRMIRNNIISVVYPALDYYVWSKEKASVHMIVNILKQSPREYILEYIEQIVMPLYAHNYYREAFPFCRQFWHYFWEITDKALFIKELDKALSILPAFNFKSNFTKIVSKIEDWGLEFIISESFCDKIFSYGNIIQYANTLNEYPRFQRAFIFTLLKKKSEYPWHQGKEVFKYFSFIPENMHDVLLKFSLPIAKNKYEMKKYLQQLNKRKIPAAIKKYWEARVLYWHGN